MLEISKGISPTSCLREHDPINRRRENYWSRNDGFIEPQYRRGVHEIVAEKRSVVDALREKNGEIQGDREEKLWRTRASD